MNYPSYQALCADPATQTEFLTALAGKLAAIGEDWKQREAIASVVVAGKPFSISKYLSTLDTASYDWDHDGQEARAADFVAAAKHMVAVYPHLDVPTFVFGFADLPGANSPAPAARTKFDSGVSTHLMAPTVARSSAPPSRERVEVTTEPAANSARRMRAA